MPRIHGPSTKLLHGAFKVPFLIQELIQNSTGGDWVDLLDEALKEAVSVSRQKPVEDDQSSSFIFWADGLSFLEAELRNAIPRDNPQME